MQPLSTPCLIRQGGERLRDDNLSCPLASTYLHTSEHAHTVNKGNEITQSRDTDEVVAVVRESVRKATVRGKRRQLKYKMSN